MIPGAFLSRLLFSSSALGTPRTDVLFLIVDDRTTHLGCYGNPAVKSPHIDRRASKGVRFDQAYVNTPFAIPAASRFFRENGRKLVASIIWQQKPATFFIKPSCFPRCSGNTGASVPEPGKCIMHTATKTSTLGPPQSDLMIFIWQTAFRSGRIHRCNAASPL